jgi:NET1-associated nuclear protein 1 (U3 small nucleolar RNA-associated protein 17)
VADLQILIQCLPPMDSESNSISAHQIAIHSNNRERYIILGLETAVHVFSITTSRLVRALETKKKQHVTSYKLSQCNPAHLYVSTHSGNITKWDWNSGQRIRSWETTNRTFDLHICLQETSDSAKDIIFTVHQHGNGQRAISLSNPESKLSSRRLDSKVILETSSHVEAIQPANNGKILIVRAGEKLLVGTTSELGSDFMSVDYTWREIALPAVATCFDIHEHTPSNSSTLDQPLKEAQLSVVDVVIGESQGSLLVYNDILNTLSQVEDAREVETETGLISSRLHWHRNAVKTVRWSRDGNLPLCIDG